MSIRQIIIIHKSFATYHSKRIRKRHSGATYMLADATLFHSNGKTLQDNYYLNKNNFRHRVENAYLESLLHSQKKRYKSCHKGCTFSKGKLLSILGANM